MRPWLRACVCGAAVVFVASCGGREQVEVGSKKFTESVILGELATQVMASRGFKTKHRAELGGTRLLWNALVNREIDVYPEYLGTIRQEILASEGIQDDAALPAALAAKGIVLGTRLGFNNSYSIGMKEETAARLGIRTISDLAAHRDAVLGFSHEFIDRADGWPALRQRYRMTPKEVRGLDHDVAYQAVDSGAVTAIEVYTTDAGIVRYGLRVLEDDRDLFQSYHAVYLWRADFAKRNPDAVAALEQLAGRIDDDTMRAMNMKAKVEHVRERRVAANFLMDNLGTLSTTPDSTRAGRIANRTREHLYLVFVSLLLALVVAVPLGIFAARRPNFGHAVLAVVGVLQTIPSMALLVLMIPLLGIGSLPALAAMFVYSLLPILRNTATGLTDIAPALRESAAAMGLSLFACLRLVELPIASRAILAGIKTSAVLNVGTATLGALIGAGGYGQPILTGIRLDSVPTILEGAIPAAVMALAVEGFFAGVERFVVPRGLRLSAAK
jgi:osmoprotectant transport system permease protein